MGTSLKVAPVSEILGHIPHSTPVILINKTPIFHLATDIMLLGDCDFIVEFLCRKLGWHLPSVQPSEDVVGTEAAADKVKSKVARYDNGLEKLDLVVPPVLRDAMAEPMRLKDSHAWVFEGAEPAEVTRLETLLEEMEDEDEGQGHDEGGDGQESESQEGEGDQKKMRIGHLHRPRSTSGTITSKQMDNLQA